MCDNVTNEQLVARIRAGIDIADNMLRLWQQTEKFIGKLALKYQAYAELKDLKQEGYIGLCEAVRHYNAEQGVLFLTYATFWIKQTMKKYVDNCSSVVRIPEHEREWIAKYNKMCQEYRQYYGTEPTEQALCYLLDVSREKFNGIQKSAKMGQIQSLSEPIGEEERAELVDTLASGEDIEADVAERLDTAAMRNELWIAVDGLPDDQGDVIRKRYKESMTRMEAGNCLGITAGAVRNLESKAMRTLRTPSKCRKFKVYVEEYLSAGSYRHVGVDSFQRTWTSEGEREVIGY